MDATEESPAPLGFAREAAPPADATLGVGAWSRGVTAAIYRLDEFIVRFLGAARSGVWTITTLGDAVCIDVFERDGEVHRRERVRSADDASQRAMLDQLDAQGIVAVTAGLNDTRALRPGVSAMLAVGLHWGGRMGAFICAEDTGAVRVWNAEEKRFMQSMAEVVRELLAMVDTSPPADAESSVPAELLSQVSHELRTPLNAILGFAQLLERDSIRAGQPQHEYVAQIQRAGRHLLDVISETLDFSRLESQPIELDVATIAVADVVADCLAMVQRQADAAGVTIVNAVRSAEWKVAADSRRLSQALLNLLSNAIKYNRDGGTVFVECATDGIRTRIRVTDTGVGLADEQISALFQPFNRLGMEASAIEGVGLGLAITRRLIDAMGGRITVTSQPAVGTTFEIDLPRR